MSRGLLLRLRSALLIHVDASVNAVLLIGLLSDIGFIGGAVTLTSFQRDFNIAPHEVSAISGNVVASMQAGCFFGALSIAFLTDRIGRRLGLIVAGAIAVVASVMQTVSVNNLGLFYAGRVIGGLGVGSASSLVPLYVGEMAPKEIRGKLRKILPHWAFSYSKP